MSVHPGITCDKCERKPVEGRHYACLVCEDYSLCGDCNQIKSVHKDHQACHPTLPILAPPDRDRVLKNQTPSQIKIFSCPYCGKEDLSINMLATHCLKYHPFNSCKVRCPLCVTFDVQDKQFWIAEDTLLLHLLINHQNEDGYVLDLNDNECIVCFDNISSDSKTIVCGHVFHGNCITTWLQNKDTCPLCRKIVRN